MLDIIQRKTLKEIAQKDGINVFTEKISSLINENKIHPKEMSIAEIFEACGGERDIHRKTVVFRESIGPAAFSVITSALINKMVIEGYSTQLLPIDKLCTNMPSNLPNEKVAGFTEMDEPKAIAPGGEYEDSDLTDKYVTTGEDTKYGRLLNITEEAVLFDQTGQLLTRASTIGERIINYKFKKIIYQITDTGTDVYYPSGTATALYAAGNSQVNALADYTDINLAEVKLAAQTDDRGERIEFPENGKSLLVPSTLKATAWMIINATEILKQTSPVKNPYAGLDWVSSTYLDSLATGTWYYGFFKKAFFWKDTIPLQVLRQDGQQVGDSWKRDIVASFKVRFRGKLFAVSNVYIIKNTAS